MLSPSSNEVLTGLKRYTIKQKVGSGGMATVYCADDHVLGREVALKMMHEHLISSPESVRRFASEAKAVATLSHENIVKIFDYGEFKSRPYLVMEYVNGHPLQTLLDRVGTLPNLVAVDVCRQVLMGLACAHSKGIFHRDIKPDNLIIDPEGVVKIMDFGIAYIVNQESVTMTGSFIGSPRYISPEQAAGKPLAGTTDVFSLGVMMYALLSGTLPFNADVAAAVVHSIIHDTPPPVYTRNKQVLFWLSDLVDLFLRKDPLVRPDAPTALTNIDRECFKHDVTVGRDRLRRFIDKPENYCALERQELFEHYRARARKGARDKQVAVALKSLEQARAFKPLTKEDERMIAAYSLRRRLKTAVAAALLLGIAATGLYLLLHFVPKPRTRPRAALVSRDKQPNAPPVVASPRAPDSTPERAALKTSRGMVTPPKVRQKPALKLPREPLPDSLARAPVAPGSGFVKIQTNPPWAKVYIDGIERGITPATTVFPVQTGLHEFTIVKEGFSAYTKECSVKSNDTEHLRIQLSQ